MGENRFVAGSLVAWWMIARWVRNALQNANEPP